MIALHEWGEAGAPPLVCLHGVTSHGRGYVSPHDDPRGFELDFLPEELRGRRYYRSSGHGEEGD